jgi:hypothetical protein
MKKHVVLKVLTIFMVLSLSSCGEMLNGAGHMAYGFSTFMIGLFKFVGILILVIVVGAIIINIIKSIFN